MRKFDITTNSNVETTNGYVKIGSYPLQPQEKSNYNFPANSDNMVLDIYWTSNSGSKAHAQYSVALRNSTQLNIEPLGYWVKNAYVPEYPIAYVRTDDGFDIYVDAGVNLFNYGQVKCNIEGQTQETRFIPESGNYVKDITDLNPTRIGYNVIGVVNSDIENVNLKNVYVSDAYQGLSSTATVALPNYSDGQRWTFKIMNYKGSMYNTSEGSIFGGSVNVLKLGSSTVDATLNNGSLNITGLEYSSWVTVIMQRH